MPIDPRLIFMFLIFATVFSFGQAAWGLFGARQTRRAVNRRLATAERAGSLGELVLELRKQRASPGWPLGLQLGLACGSHHALGVSVECGAGRWSPALVLGAVGLLLHTVLGATAAWRWARRAARLPDLFAGARSRRSACGCPRPRVMVGGLEAGHPIPTSINLVGRELPDPIGSEFGMAADEIAFGATLEQAVARISDRCRNPDVDLFSAAIRLQEKSGGNLTGLLKTLARTVRERHKMRLKIRAASSEGRVSAYILSAAPVVCFIFINVSQPHYYGDLLHTPFIQIGLDPLRPAGRAATSDEAHDRHEDLTGGPQPSPTSSRSSPLA